MPKEVRVKGSALLLIVLAVAAVAVTLVNYLPEELFLPKTTPPKALSGPDSTDQALPQEPELKPEKKLSLLDSLRMMPPVKTSRQEPRPAQPLPGSRYSIEVQKSAFKLILFKDGKPFKAYNIAVGNQRSDKLEKADLITPLGNFRVVSIENSSQRSPKNGRTLGPWFIRLLTGHFETASGKAWSGIGIQGGGLPSEIGRSLATDCVIMQDTDIIELKEYIHEDHKEFHLPVRIVP